tara:strand:- start:1430 stop:1843 length:414 start_codon:yes stop_codon:yes gene_type:complete
MGKISSIYGSNQILFAAGSRKGKSKKRIAGMIKSQQYKKKTYTKTINKKRSSYMGYTKLGKVTMYVNKDATEENRQPHFKGYVKLDHKIPKGAEIGLAGWLNEKGSDKSLFFAISAKDEQLTQENLDLDDSESDTPF